MAPGRCGSSSRLLVTAIVASVSPELLWSVTEVQPGEFVVDGEVDAHSAPSLTERLMAATGSKIVLDLDGVTFMDSSGLRIIVQLRQRELEGGPALEIRRPSRSVTRLLEIAGLAGLLLTDEGV